MSSTRATRKLRAVTRRHQDAAEAKAKEPITFEEEATAAAKSDEPVHITDGWIKMHRSALMSSLWQLPPEVFKLFWTMMLVASKTGYVSAATVGLAHTAVLSLESCEEGLRVLSAPDKYSRNPRLEGRRLRPVAGGFQIINYVAYKNSQTLNQLENAARQREFQALRRSAT